MAGVAAINEPFLLSTYSATQRVAKADTEFENRRRPAGVYASYQSPSSNSDGFVSVAARSDGVHILDVATLHPIVSHTLGPSTTFACAPLSQHQPSKHTHTTYAVIASSPDVGTEDQHKIIWKWTENLSSPLTDRPSTSSRNQHESVVAPHPIFGLYDCNGLSERLLAVSPSGDISLFTADLELKATHPASAEDNQVLSTHVFSRSSCSFLEVGSQGAVVVLILGREGSVQLEAITIDAEDPIHQTITHEIPVSHKSPQSIAAASCSASGVLNIISYTGLWHTFSFTTSSLSELSPPIQLRALSFITPPPSSASSKKGPAQKNKTEKHPTSPTLSLLALTSSHVLFAALTPNNEVALLLWDTQYTVLLASHLFPLPPSYIAQSSSLSFSLLSPSASGVKAGTQQAILVISQLTPDGQGKAPIKSSIHVVPYSVPAHSTLANAVGRATPAARWLVSEPAGEKEGETMSPQEVVKSKLLVDMKTAVEQNRPQAANILFTDWEGKERGKKDGNSSKSVEFGYVFVKDLLEVIIQPQKPPSPLYSSEIVRLLVERGVVRSAMVEGGLLAPLRIRNDWQSINLALLHVPDLSEHELVETLNVVATQLTQTDSDAMQVDSALSRPLTVPDFLSALIKHRQFIEQELILAFRRHLRAAEALTIIVETISGWLKMFQTQEMKLAPAKNDLVINQYGVPVVGQIVQPKTVRDLPPMDRMVNFLQSLLDASFLILLQHPPAHRVLKDLRSHVEVEIDAVSQTEKLRLHTEGFARAHAGALREAEMAKTKGNKGIDSTEKEEPKNDWRQRRREAHEKSGMMGAYRLEELVL